MLLKKHQRETIKRMFSVLMCFIVLFWTYSSNLSIFANAEGNAVGLSFDQTSVTEGAGFQANMTATPENSDEQYTFSVPEGLSISGIASGGENIEKVSEGKQALTFTWNGNGNQAAVKVQAEKAGNYVGQLSSASGSAQASVTVNAAEVEEPEQTAPEQSESEEASTPESSEESSDEDPAPETEVDEEQQPSANDSESAVGTEQQPAAIADDSVTEDESSKANQTRASGTYDHVDVQVAVDATVMIDGKEVKIKIDKLDPNRLTVVGEKTGPISYVGVTSTYDRNTKAWELRKTGFTINKNETFTVSYTFTSDEITGLEEGETITYTGQYSYYVNNSCGADEDHGRGLDIHITADRLADFFSNGTLVIDKTIEGGTPSKEATFTFNVTSVEDGKAYGPYTVTGDNFVTITDLPAGSYIVEEVNLPDGYTVNGASQQVVVKTDGEVAKVTFENYYSDNTASLTIKKSIEGIDADGTFNFLVTGPNNYSKEVTIDTVNGNNSYTLNGLTPGNYTVKELDPSDPSDAFDDYRVVSVTAGGQELVSENGSYSADVTLVKGKNELQFVNKYSNKGSLTIKKVDADNNNAPLAGAEFTLYKKDTTEQVGTPQTTNAEGVATFKDLALGDYDIKETTVPTGYQKVADSSVTVGKDNGDVTVTIENSRIKGSIIVNKLDASTEQPLAGAEFTLYDKDNNPVEVKKTDENGNVTFEGLVWGQYYVKETAAPDGYEIVTESTSVTIDGEHTKVPVTFTDARILGTISLVKVDKESGQVLQGAEFALYKAGTDDQVGTKQTTNDQGIVTFKDLAWGNYEVRELKAPEGYEKISGAIDVVIDAQHTAVQQLKVENTRTLGTLTITKTDSNSNAVLQGAEFELYKSGTQEKVGEAKTTNENGIAVFEDLPWGSYDVVETKAPQGYSKIEGVAKTVIVGQKTIDVYTTIQNSRILGELTVKKVDAETSAALQGAEFTLYDSEGKAVGQPETTNADGTVTFKGLAWGDYELKETKAPQGYKEVEKAEKVTINQEATEVELEIKNIRILGTLNVTKVDVDNNNAPVAGAEFTLYKAGTEVKVGEPKTTNADGIATFENLPWGDYDLIETKAPQGYSEIEGVAKTVTVGQKTTVVYTTIQNSRILGELTVKKIDAETGAALQGAVFTLYDSEGKAVGEPQTTNADGITTFDGLAWGEYKLEETKAPTGYTAAEGTETVTINQEKQEVSLDIKNNRIPGSITVHKVDAETGTALQGAEFTLYDKTTGNQVGNPKITDAEGNVTFDNLPWGNYEVKETKAPQGYNVVTESASVTVDQGHTNVPLKFTDTRILGILTVVKVDADNNNVPLAGAEFTLYNSEGKAVGEPQTTNEDGIAKFQGLAWGDYEVKETKAPQGYKQVEAAQKATIGQTATAVSVTIDNSRILGTLTVTKVDADNGDAPLAGAEFTLYNKAGNPVGEPQTTNEEGIATFENLAWGDYVVKETKAPQGYEKVAEGKAVVINQQQTKAEIQFDNSRIMGTLTVTKVDAQTKAALKGAQFTLYKAGTSEQVGEPQTTNSQGVVIFEGLAWGDYEVKETKAPQGYEKVEEAQKVTINQKATEVELEIVNTRILGTLTVAKVDEESKEPLAGAEFTLYKAGTNEQVGETQTTNEEGLVTFKDLAWGSYDVKETKAPQGYEKTEGVVKTVAIGQKATEVNVKIDNTRILGTLTVTKVDADNENAPLAGAEFTLYKAGEQVGKPQTTNEDGVATFEDLAWGDYELKETKAPQGYEKVTEAEKVTIGQKDTAVGVTIENTRILGTIKVAKVDADNENAPLAGAEFTLYDQAGEPVGEPQTTNEDGVATFEDLAWGDYEVKETKAPQGYQKVEGSHKVTINAAKTEINVTIQNTRIPGTITIQKVDADNGNAPLAGAEFTLYQAGKQVGKPQTTDENGVVTFENLAWGDYEVKETKAPQGYDAVEESALVTISQAQTSVELTFTNTRILGTITVAKVDAENQAALAGAEFTLYQAGEQVGKPQTTDEDGVATFEGLAWGDYELKETKAPQGYEKAAEAKTVTIGQKATAVGVTIENTRILGTLTVTKVDADNDKAPLAGAEFTLYQAGEQVGEPQTTNEDGVAVFEGLAWGDFELRETKAPQGYEKVEEAQKVTINQKATEVDLEIENTRILGTLTVTKVDADNDNAPLAGAEFTLYQAGEQVGEPQTANEDGIATFENLAWGDYELKETKAPQGYEKVEEAQKVTINQDATKVEMEIENTRILGTVTVIKVDADNDNAPLAGAEFTLYNKETGEQVGDPQTTDDEGIATFEGLAWGDYELEETEAPEGYQQVTEKAAVTVHAGQTEHQVTIENVKIKADLIVTKTDAETGDVLPGATFILTQDGQFIGEAITDESGKAVFENLVYGDYELTEYEAPTGYLLPEENQWPVSIKDTTDVELTVENTAKAPGLLVEKTADKKEAQVGDTVTYTINVTNTGNMALENVSVVDDMVGLEETVELLGINETVTFTETYTVTSEDVGDLQNIAIATAVVDDETISEEGGVIITVVKEEVISPVVDEPTQMKGPIQQVYQWITNPKTGEEATNILVIAAAFLLAGLGLYVYRKKAKH